MPVLFLFVKCLYLHFGFQRRTVFNRNGSLATENEARAAERSETLQEHEGRVS